MRRSILLLPACLALSMIAGCGNKGPLYMPPATPKPAPAHAHAPAPAHGGTSAAPASGSTSAAPASSSSVVTKPLGGS